MGCRPVELLHPQVFPDTAFDFLLVIDVIPIATDDMRTFCAPQAVSALVCAVSKA